MYNLQPGDVVECIDGTPVLSQSLTMPEYGRIYRVESVRRESEGQSIRLVEISPDCYLGGPCTCGNCGWDQRRFRRVQAHEKQMRIFRNMLLDVPASARLIREPAV